MHWHASKPQGTASGAGYLPGLDGIRTGAVFAVVAYHLQVPMANGGVLGASVFFALSGYLITSLLIQEFECGNRIDLKAFWLRRARRLLPALFLMLLVVALATAITRPNHLAETARRVLGALLGIANWTTIARGDDLQRLSGPEPLDHLWSLAIEEQFYILWPPLVFGLLWLGRRLHLKRGRLLLALAGVLLAAASTWAIVHLFHPQIVNNTRAHAGTDARAAALLIGALAALALPFARVREISGGRRAALDVIGALGLNGVLACIAFTDTRSQFLYQGGELALAVATGALAVAAAHPATIVARMLGVFPLRWIGARSYGIYLWHLPVVALMPSHVLARSAVLRGAIEVGVILILAAASYRLLEEPIRRRAFGQWPVRARWWFGLRGLGLVLGATAALVVWPVCFPPPVEIDPLASEPVFTAAWPATSCRQVVYIGDSTSVGLISLLSIPNVDNQIAARYHAVGVERFQPEIFSSRSMVEHFTGQLNATDLVKKIRSTDYRGCWVIALGTNDPANVDGDITLLGERIEKMMKQIGGAPVLWTTTKTLRDEGSYRNANMMKWNQTLLESCAHHPNMRVYDWAGEVQDEWFATDEVHFNQVGNRHRSARLARALARAFPKDQPPFPKCVVSGVE